MLVLDTSVIFAILAAEPEEDIFLKLLTAESALIGAPTLVETRMVVESHAPGRAKDMLDRLVARKSITIVHFDVAMFEAASEAFVRFGKGRGHPAKLNLGDCLTYAVAKVHALPLLFKGNDFVHTDIEPAYRPAP